MRKSRQFLLSRSNIFFWYLRSSWCAISNNQETIGRTRNETFQTELFHRGSDAKRRRERNFFRPDECQLVAVVSRSWNVRYRPRKIITRSSGPTVYLLYTYYYPLPFLERNSLNIFILYPHSARIENFRNNFI